MITVLTTIFNCQQWVERCIQSIQEQKVKDFKCYLLDDLSEDASVEICKKLVKDDDRFVIVHNEDKLHQVGNYDNIMRKDFIDDDDIVIEVDGDDWLPDPDVFGRILEAYSDGKTWITCGQFIYSNGAPGFTKRVMPSLLRKQVFTASHMRTWKAFLWRKIARDDLKFGKTYPEHAGDIYFMFPMLEMAGEEHFKMLYDINYVYNGENPLSEHRINYPLQQRCEAAGRLKRPYTPLSR